MFIKWVSLFAFFFSCNVIASSEHGGGSFHAIELELGSGIEQHEDRFMFSELDAWYGNDNDKWVLTADLEKPNGHSLDESYQFMYRRYLSEFWNWQAGLQFDRDDHHLTSLLMGFHGLAPYFFETDINLLVSEKGDLSLLIEQENELLLTQKWFLLPSYGLNLSAQDIKEKEIASGLTSMDVGLKLEYEYVRSAAVFFAFEYERLLFGTADLAKKHSERLENSSFNLGLRFLF